MRLTETMLGAALLLALAASQASADNCRTEGFREFIRGVQAEAVSQGVSPRAAAVLDTIEPDPAVVKSDRGQGVFAQSFLQFSDRMISPARLENGERLMRRYAPIFDSVEQRYGVPAPAITALWGLETDFGGYTGNFSTLRALATLSYDCRRPDFFRPQLLFALRLVEEGDLKPSEMKGAWAGEIGQTQFMPKDYFEKAIDFDGDGRRDLLGSIPDALASTGNFLQQLGWQRGQPWLEEVRVPADLPWDQADVKISHPRSEWGRWGVVGANGAPLPSDDLPASLILPMGRLGPAFLAYPNFMVFRAWNEAGVYSTTAAYFAARLAGAPAVQRGQANPLQQDDMADLQRLLHQHGFDVGEIDGKLGNATRAGVKQAQLKVGLPADSYPTSELIRRLRVTE